MQSLNVGEVACTNFLMKYSKSKSDNTFKNGPIVVIHRPSYQTVHIYVVIHFYDRLVFSNGGKYVQIFVCLFISVVIGYPIIKN